MSSGSFEFLCVSHLCFLCGVLSVMIDFFFCTSSLDYESALVYGPVPLEVISFCNVDLVEDFGSQCLHSKGRRTWSTLELLRIFINKLCIKMVAI